ncbi:MAG: C-terminal target protein [Bacteroidota bacterium]|nr:C-terminal target protein [Bacteroidota bacterium]
MHHFYRLLIVTFLLNPVLAKANSGFVKLLFGIEPKEVLESKDKSAVVLTEGSLGNKGFFYLQQTDSLGNIQWLVNLFPIQDTSVQFGVDMQTDNNGNIFVITHHKNGNNGLLQKVSKIRDGVILYTRILPNIDSLQPVPFIRTYAKTEDSGLIHILYNKFTNTFYLQKFDAQASIVWTKILDHVNFNASLDSVALFGLQFQTRIKKVNPNKYAITGIGFNTSGNKYELFQAIYDNTSQTFQYNHFQLPEIIVSTSSKPILFDEAITNLDKMRIAILNYNTSVALNSYFISDLNMDNGTKNIAYTFQDSSNNAHFPQRLYIDKAGNLFFLKPNSLYKRNPAGAMVWNRIMFPDRVISANVIEQDFVFMQNFTELSDSSFYIIGRGGKGYPGNFCFCFGALIKANKNGVIYERLINGNVFVDENKNCSSDNEAGLKQILVEATTGTASFYATTDSTGNYSIPVDIGVYTVKIYLNNNTYWQACTPSVQVNTLNDTTIADFAVQKQIECPYLDVDVATPFLRRCFENTYNIHYCNYGTATAQNAYVKIVFDSLLQVTSSSIPWTSVNGNTYTFLLGNINEQQCGDFNIHAYLSCDSSVLGQTHCVQAFIFPDSLCGNQAGWDGAIIQVTGRCVGDSVILLIKNIGTGNMTAPKKYYVLEGDFLKLAPNDFQLNASDSKIVTVPVNGNTITLLAQQTDNYPFPGMPAVSIEGCNGALQPGYVNDVSQNNSSPFVANNCMQNIGSYDPNFKAALPTGLDTMHFVNNKTPLEYIIHFQNTGTDTAFSVAVTDTISKMLNISTLKMGASSHPYSYNVSGTGVLNVNFNNIQLPDSSTDPSASQGFFKFTIQPKNTLPDYNRINNDANIYFDFNNGVKTNSVFHTVKENLFNVISSVSNTYKDHVSIRVFPNPFSDVVTFKMADENQNYLYEFHLTDLQGKLLWSQYFRSSLTINGKDLNSDLYLYTITHNNSIVAAGKLIRQ